ncbi:MAG: YbhB/YbcL family Raf kinase inhibitor-like protein, partial [Desulfovibrionales bacterium]
MEITSAAFDQGQAIPKKYSCDGQDISPPLSWSEIPDGTQSLAFILEDPDAPMGLFVHWVLAEIPPDTQGLPESVSD